MKKTLLFTVTLVMMASSVASAQKKPLDHSVYDRWESTSAPSLTDNGKIVSYQINRQDGDQRLVFENLETGKSLTIERGNSASISRDGNWAVFKVKPFHADVRKAKIKKLKADKMPKDTLRYINLNSFEVTDLGNVNKHFTVMEAEPYLGFEKGAKDSTYYVFMNLASGRKDTLRNVSGYTADRFGKQMCVTFKKNKKDSLSKNCLMLFNLTTMKGDTLSSGMENYYSPKFNHETNKIVFLASNDKRKEGPKHCSVMLYERRRDGSSVTELLPQDYSEGLPEKWAVTEKAGPRFSKLSDRIFLGVSAPVPQKDTTLIDFETPQLDIWSWDKPMVPPGEKLNKGKLENITYTSCLDVTTQKLTLLCTEDSESVSLIDGGESDWALIHNDGPYRLTRTWDSNRFVDISLVNLKTGEKKMLFEKHSGSVGVSPEGKYLYWFDFSDLNGYTYNLATGETVNVTKGLDGIFYNDEDDHPDVPGPFSGAYWYEGDSAFLLAEKYDIWKLQPDGKNPVNLTAFEGRNTNRQFRYARFTRSEISSAHSEVGVQRVIGRKDILDLSVFDRTTKQNGFATVSAAKPGVRDLVLQNYSFQHMNHALKSKAMVYRKGNFNECVDVYLTMDGWKTERKLSSINPQKEEYLWGDVQLVKWNAYDGTPLEGLLYTPENLDPNRKYPMIVYFYEKNTQNMFSHYSPAPSRSIVCFPFCTSNDYVVFVPDIVYKDGHPGECAYNCICAGAESMCEQFQFIDKSKMAIQGQSWGGYQTAYLVTRTDMFAAAEAGAPVGNMTSAYGGIRWGSGVFRAMQYEHGQSRIGKSLWDEGGRELYIENSPVFHADKVTTPLLIMHNDNDGAVPWYQGIEMFMAVRRQQKPVWLLQYNREAHNLNERRNCKDLSVRMMQFFDHYLKGKPMPAWMKDGIPVTRKGSYLGYETTE
ncbi:MAG: S9 family peptidase [Bacteroidales bacterium]|nr:S9 family peptidase [Candidatus Cryptobacteroides equifaecalis]